jgi:hypothetical protein
MSLVKVSTLLSPEGQQQQGQQQQRTAMHKVLVGSHRAGCVKTVAAAAEHHANVIGVDVHAVVIQAATSPK